MDWQLPDIGKTITKTILPSILSAHTVLVLHRKPCICDNFWCVKCPHLPNRKI